MWSVPRTPHPVDRHDVREGMVKWLKREQPGALPRLIVFDDVSCSSSFERYNTCRRDPADFLLFTGSPEAEQHVAVRSITATRVFTGSDREFAHARWTADSSGHRGCAAAMRGITSSIAGTPPAFWQWGAAGRGGLAGQCLQRRGPPSVCRRLVLSKTSTTKEDGPRDHLLRVRLRVSAWPTPRPPYNAPAIPITTARAPPLSSWGAATGCR